MSAPVAQPDVPQVSRSQAPPRRTARPRTLSDTGLSLNLVADLVLKHLLAAGALDLGEIAGRLALAGTVVEPVLGFLRREALVGTLSPRDAGIGPRYELTERGRSAALDARDRSGYAGPAPVTLEDYVALVRAQSVHARKITRERMTEAFRDVVVRDGLLDQLGPALNSGRAIFIHGRAGTGKTFIARRLIRALRDPILIPHAVAINDVVVAIYDGAVHRSIERPEGYEPLRFDDGDDPRYVRCERPMVIGGGELTLDLLDVQFDAGTRNYIAPLQIKANNGVLLIDDLGRQRVAPQALLNRWIVPMEEQHDHLSFGSGRHARVPFDVALVFSTNHDPASLIDAALLRRIGYKIEFTPLERGEYLRIWRDSCLELGIDFDLSLVLFAVDELHAGSEMPLLPCHPRDLLRMASDIAAYQDQSRQITEHHLRWAWNNYFVIATETSGGTGQAAQEIKGAES
jgi:predicted ATPase with chaperone activity